MANGKVVDGLAGLKALIPVHLMREVVKEAHIEIVRINAPLPGKQRGQLVRNPKAGRWGFCRKVGDVLERSIMTYKTSDDAVVAAFHHYEDTVVDVYMAIDKRVGTRG